MLLMLLDIKQCINIQGNSTSGEASWNNDSQTPPGENSFLKLQNSAHLEGPGSEGRIWCIIRTTAVTWRNAVWGAGGHSPVLPG